jgi:hypothetical protein
MKLSLSDTRLVGASAWVAEIVGTDPQYHFSRCFLHTERRAKTITVSLEPGKVSEVCCPDQDERYFVELRKGLLTRISPASVRGHFQWACGGAIDRKACSGICSHVRSEACLRGGRHQRSVRRKSLFAMNILVDE